MPRFARFRIVAITSFRQSEWIQFVRARTPLPFGLRDSGLMGAQSLIRARRTLGGGQGEVYSAA